jgi:uncharacterized surface protein with fasciclin (FAS1) repeats
MAWHGCGRWPVSGGREHHARGSSVTTRAEVRLKVMDGHVMVNGATVVKPDIEASNGVIHVIDSVILPE